MKKFTLLAVAALIAASSAFAQQPVAKQRGLKKLPKTSIVKQGDRKLTPPKAKKAEGRLSQSLSTQVDFRQLMAQQKRQAKAGKATTTTTSRAKAAGIVDQPEGTVYDGLVYSYEGIGYNWLDDTFYGTSSANGTATIVEGTDGNIYIKGLMPTLYVDEAYWLKATKGEKDTIIIKPQVAGIYEWSNGTVTEYTITLLQRDEEAYAEDYIDYQPAENPDIKLIYSGEGYLRTPDELNVAFDGGFPALVIGTTYPYTVEDEDTGETTDYILWDYEDGIVWACDIYPNEATITELPDGATIEELIFLDSDGNSSSINVAFVGNDFYFQISEDVPGWVKGTIDGDKVIVPSGQYLGIDEYYEVHAYFAAATYTYDEDNGLDYEYTDQLVFNYDADAKRLEAPGYIWIEVEGAVENDEELKDTYFLSYAFDPAIFAYQEVAATPADPDIYWFFDYDEDHECAELDLYIPTVDVDGKYITPEKLFYSVYVDDELFVFTDEEYELGEDLSEIPYLYTDDNYQIGYSEYYGINYVSFYFQPAKNVGVQSIFRGGNEEHKSNVVWYELEEDAGVKGVKAGTQAVSSEAYYDAAGRKVSADARGFVIKTVTFADGSKKSFKVVRK